MLRNDKITLLSDSEIETLYAIPQFNSVEQKLYLSFNKHEMQMVEQYRTCKTQVFFMLNLGYFKAKQQFFSFNLQDNADAEYINQHYFNIPSSHLIGKADSKTLHKQRLDILAYLKYRDWSLPLKKEFTQKLCEFIRYYPKPHSAVRQLLHYFEAQNTIIPSYRILQDIFSVAFSIEDKRIKCMISTIPLSITQKLRSLLEYNNVLTQLNVIRADQKDFQYTAVKTEVRKAYQIRDIYEFSKSFLPTLKLSKNAIRYYAEITEQYAASRLRRLTEHQRWLHTLCFIYHRYQQIMDNLITSFMYHVKSILDAGKTFAEMAMMEHNSKIVAHFPQLAEFLTWFPNRESTLTHEELNKKAYAILPEDQFPILAEFISGSQFDKEASKWQFYFKSHRIFSLYLRPIFTIVSLDIKEFQSASDGSLKCKNTRKNIFTESIT